ncbi:MAG: hypothetical protein CSA75_03240, partial [Sorangium cellulosum]
ARSLNLRQVPPSRPPKRQSGQGDNAAGHYPLESESDGSWSGDAVHEAPAIAPPPPHAQMAPPPAAPMHSSAPNPRAPLRVPAPPRVPTPPQHDRMSSSPSSHQSVQPTTGEAPSLAANSLPASPRPSVTSAVGFQALTPSRDIPAYGSPESIQIPVQRVAAVTLVTRVEQSADLKSLNDGTEPADRMLERVDRALRDGAEKLRSNGDIPPQADVDAIVREARDELLGLGCLDPLLRDEDVLEIHIHRHSWMTTLRASGPRRAEIPFASEATLDRILRRLCARANAPVTPDETTLERHIQPGNASLVAAFPPVSATGPVATIRKCPPTSQTLEDLVRSGTMSRAMASFLANAIAGHINILLTVAPGADGRSMMSGLISAVRPNEHVVVARNSGFQIELPRNATSMLANGADGAKAVRAAARLGPDCLFITQCEGAITSEVLDSVAGGCDGVVASMRAPTLRHAFARAVPEVAALRAGLPIEAVREWLNASFDLAVELVRLRDGRSRVARISEPAGVEGNAIALRDIFTFTVERTASGGTVEGSFHPSGVVPKVAENLQARGLGLDPGLFRR